MFIPWQDRKQLPQQGDTCLRTTALAALRSSGYGPLTHLGCEVTGGVAHISGTVPSYYLKQKAQAALLAVEDLKSVNNMVEVRGVAV
jgi:hypothetical protein